MKLLAIDGNSIINRAFYGIRPLSTKDGMFTNGIYGFMNILFKLESEVKPDGIAVAFDLKAPTFRHKQYSEYKAGRKPMPDELAMQLPVLKEVLTYYGCKVLEKEGFEADDILGTLAEMSQNSGNQCVIATGDRDSLQLVSDSVQVMLAATKAGAPVVTVYDTAKIKEDYGVTPLQMIEIKALQGDSSDNIPGVAGVGPKTAGDLISKYGSIDKIYSEIDTLDIKDNLRNKLINDKDNAFLSRELGTICRTVPIDNDITSYALGGMDKSALKALLIKLEMFKTIDKLQLNSVADVNTDITATPITATEIKIIENDFNVCLDNAVMLFDADKKVVLALLNDTVYLFNKNLTYPLMAKNIITHNCKGLYHSLDLEFEPSIAFDTMLAAYLLIPDSKDYSISRIADIKSVAAETFEGEFAGCISELKLLSEIYKLLSKEIEDNGQLSLLRDIEIPLSYTLYQMEKEGFLVDANGIKAYGEFLAHRAYQLQQEIFDIIGYEFNLNSPKQLGEALFEKLGLPHGKKTKTGYSTSAEVLENLRYESDAVELLLEYRSVTKLKSTYCDGLIKVIGDDGRIHSTFNQTETRTGRISSLEPNLQNIPVRTKLGRELRKFFTAKEGYVLVDADYSQIELRVLAHIADDETMCNAFLNNVDIHTLTASQVFNMPVDMVTSEMRSRAKAVNFGIVYGIGAFSLSKDIGVSVAQAKKYIEGYMNTYKGVREYMDNTVEKAKQDGYVTTSFGRRRYLPELASSNFNMRAFGERVARNMPIQGTAADIIKIAMVKVFNRLKAENLNAKLILQVHDELICEAPISEQEKVAAILKEEMEAAVKMKVPMTSEVKCGKTWFETK
ncbi:MAG: DNA polymerase I [Clostridia bacterium]|nr:DNA polymerase I [Clostridia bacterium]